jgi:hypothetical protein
MLVFWGTPVSGLRGEPTVSPRPSLDFQTKILPILQNSCFACHAPNESHQNTSRDDATPGKGIEKEIMNAVNSFEMGPQFPFPDEQSPVKQLDKLEKKIRRRLMPPESQKKLGLGSDLSDKDRGLLLNWIAQIRKTYPE